MPADRRTLRRALFDVAVGQAGYFTAAQAKEAGYSHQAQAHHIQVGLAEGRSADCSGWSSGEFPNSTTTSPTFFGGSLAVYGREEADPGCRRPAELAAVSRVGSVVRCIA
jgi:hypothetical protein